MITYKAICEKLGFDPIVDGYEYNYSGHEDDTQISPFAILSLEELDFLSDYTEKHSQMIEES